MADNNYAVSNLQQVKENIMAYASYAEGHQYSPLYEKIEEAQAAVQRLIDAIEEKPEDDDKPEEVRKAIKYVRENMDEDDMAILHAEMNKCYKMHLIPDSNVMDCSKVSEQLEEYGEENDLPEGWWEEYGEMDEWLVWL